LTNAAETGCHSPKRSKQRTRRWTLAGVVAALASLGVAGCAANLDAGSGPTAELAQPQNATARQQPVKIAMLLPLKGFDQTAAIAKSMKQAGAMALFERNDPRIQLIVKDDGGTAIGAKAAAEEAVREGAEIVLGPLFASAVKGAAPITQAANIPLIAFSNDRAVAGEGVYLMSFLPEPEVERIVAFAAARGKRRFAALVPDDSYGQTVAETFRRAANNAGGSIVAIETYPAGANAMIEPAQRVLDIVKQADTMGAPVDALFLPGGQDVLPSIGPILSYSGVDTKRVKLLGTGAWEFPNIGRDDNFVGGWYPSPDPRGWKEFSGKFARTFGQAPPRLATLAYDAVNLAIELSQFRPGKRYTTANLTRAQGFNGIDGPVRFSTGGIAERGLAVLEVQKFGSAVVDPAPLTLQRTGLGGTGASAAGIGAISPGLQPSPTQTPRPLADNASPYAGPAPNPTAYARPQATIETRP